VRKTWHTSLSWEQVSAACPQPNEMRDKLDKSHKVTVVSDSENFNFMPSNPWVGVKWRERKQVEFPVRTYLERKGINFNSNGVKPRPSRKKPAGTE